MSSSNSETARGAEGLSYENEGWEHPWWSCDAGDRGERRGRRETRDIADS